jgi:hypothetical protein
VPPEIQELLGYAGGFRFDRLKTEVDFVGSEMFAFEEALPHGVPLLGDGYGNCWMVDVRPKDGQWGQVFYVCHDPLALIVQAPSLAVFLEQIFDAARGKTDLLEVVRERTATVPEGSGTIDLRAAEIGSGFGFGLNDDIRRLGAEPVFEIRQPPPTPGFLDRLRGWWTGPRPARENPRK